MLPRRFTLSILTTLAIVLCALDAPPAGAATIYVNGATGDDTWDGLCEEWDGGTCGPKATIQAGIDAARDGYHVVVADGVYTGEGNKNLDFVGRAITVQSASGDPTTCIIDCENDGRGFYFHGAEMADSVIKGFTIMNGYAADGGALYCEFFSSPTLTDCTIIENEAEDDGGGVCCQDNSNPTLIDCTIIQNEAEDDGGGVYCTENSNPTLADCTLLGNTAVSGNGGGVFCEDASSPILTQCIITGNWADNGGGGVACREESHAVLTNCTISANVASAGSGIACDASSPTLINCTLSDNMRSGFTKGGGMYCQSSSPALVGCIIARNEADQGGALYCKGGSPELTNCTITGNAAYYYSAGGIYCWGYACAPVLTNCVLWNNWPRELYVDYQAAPVLRYCAVRGGWEGEGNIDSDPQLTPNDHLQASSPCRDAGDPEGDYADQTDSDGEARVIGDGVDIGSDEFLDTDEDHLPNWWELLHFASPTAAGPEGDEDGDGRANLEEYARGACPFVAPATYYVDTAGDDEWDGLEPLWDGEHGPKATIQAAIDSMDRFEGDVVLVGDGVYSGAGNRVLDPVGKRITVCSSAGDPTACIIDCEGADCGFYFHRGETADCVVRGLTIMNGNGSYGGGLSCWVGASPTIAACRITGNVADAHGGGVYCFHGAAPSLVNCTISDNVAGYRGGGIYCERSSPTLTNCMITNNEADITGALYCESSCNPLLSNCTIVGNMGGGLRCACYSIATLTNCILWWNTPYEVYYFEDAEMCYCDVLGGWPGEGNIDADPLFVDPDGPDDDPETWDDNDYRLAAGSPCIDAADNTAVPADTLDLDGDGDVDEPVPFDLDGNPRFVDDPATDDTGVGTPPIVDMGAYEYWPFVVGDLNCDGAVDFFDIDPFVMALVFPEEYETAYPDCSLLNADCNGDGIVDFFDLDPFVALIVD